MSAFIYGENKVTIIITFTIISFFFRYDLMTSPIMVLLITLINPVLWSVEAGNKFVTLSATISEFREFCATDSFLDKYGTSLFCDYEFFIAIVKRHAFPPRTFICARWESNPHLAKEQRSTLKSKRPVWRLKHCPPSQGSSFDPQFTRMSLGAAWVLMSWDLINDNQTL